MDSTKKNTGTSGNRKDNALFRLRNSLKDNVISMISQARLIKGTKTKRYMRMVNPESV